LVTDLATPAPTAEHLRARLVETLLADGAITAVAVEAAFRAVAREAFAPAGTDLADVYADEAVITKRRRDGQALSSVSAPWLQARMIEQAAVRAGHRVLEVGSGGCNAALLAEVVGPTGAVTSVDIDPEVIGWARRGLAEAGYPQVTAVVADGEHGHPPNAPYDAIIVTVETADIPPAWLAQLGPGGVLVAPLRMRGITRSIAFTRDGDRLVARSMLMCGFVPMQGAGSIPERRLELAGEVVVLRLDDDTTTVDIGALAAAIRGPRTEAWSQVTLPGNTSFERLLLWLAGQPVPYGRLFVDQDRAAEQFGGGVAPFATVSPAFLTADSLAYLVLRRLDNGMWEFGAHGFGPDAAAVATRMCDAIRGWDRGAPDPHVAIYPIGAALPDDAGTRLLVPRRHSTIVVTWPTRASAATA
jgi:protein-L-isoaspartate(D-aspartate) O-methyltransferase